MLIAPQCQLMLGAARADPGRPLVARSSTAGDSMAHQRELAAKQGEYDALASPVREQNQRCQAMGAADGAP